jgi:hypothetical protein
LLDLASPTAAADAERLRATFTEHTHFSLEDATGATRITPARCRSAISVLGSHGELGHDLADSTYYWRRLPYQTSALTDDPPRLRDAKRLLADSIRNVEPLADGAFRVLSENSEYRTSVSHDGFRCTCPWVAKHGTSRGPCKHVLACVLTGTPAPQSQRQP